MAPFNTITKSIHPPTSERLKTALFYGIAINRYVGLLKRIWGWRAIRQIAEKLGSLGLRDPNNPPVVDELLRSTRQ